MSAEPTVCVVMPAYRAGGTLERAARSVLDQSYSQLVLAVSIYAGDEETATIARALGDTRVIVVERPGRGIANGRNAALEHVEAELFMFLDSDDRYGEGVIEAYVDDHRASPAPALRYGDWTAVSPRDGSERPRRVYVPRGHRYEQLALDNYIATPTVMIDRAIVRELGGFDERYPHAEDWDLWLRIAQRYPVRHVPVNAAYYTRTKLERIYPRSFFLTEREIAGRQPLSRAWKLAATVLARGRYGAYFLGTLSSRRTLRMLIDVRLSELAAAPAFVLLRFARASRRR